MLLIAKRFERRKKLNICYVGFGQVGHLCMVFGILHFSCTLHGLSNVSECFVYIFSGRWRKKSSWMLILSESTHQDRVRHLSCLRVSQDGGEDERRN